ncbi:MAG: cytochrome c3 family protein [Pseudomonadota bacterium]
MRLYSFLLGWAVFFYCSASAWALQEWSGWRPPGCACHSKNPKMFEMHKPFGVKDCLACHSPGAMKMDKSDNDTVVRRKKMEDAQQKKLKDDVCRECHVKEKK